LIRLAPALALCIAASAGWAAPLSKNETTILHERDTRYPSSPPSEVALLLAEKIGREGNVDGLRAILDMRDVGLLQRAVGTYDPRGARQLPEPVEALIVRHYADPLLQNPLLGLLAKHVDKQGRYPTYRGRKLFELLYADLKGNEQFRNAIRIVATDLQGIEPELAAALPQLGSAAANELVMFLGQRRYVPAVAALKALQARIPLERNENQVLEHVNLALLQIGTPEAVQAVLERLKLLGARSAEPRAASEIWVLLINLKAQPAGSPPDYAELRAALPAELSDSGWKALIDLIASRGEKRGMPELVRALSRPAVSEDAVSALLAIGEPEDWRAARAALATPQKRLDDALADPAAFIARRGQAERQQALQQTQVEFSAEKLRLSPLKASDPQRYAAGWRTAIERREALLRDYADLPYSVGARQELAREYAALAGFLRFVLRRPDEAIAAYQAMAKLQGPAPVGIDLASIGIADIERFDKRSPRKALEQYRSMLASLGGDAARAGPARSLVPGLRRWLEHEVAYLESGKPFSGVIGRDDFAAAEVLLILGAMQPEVDPSPGLDALPPSQLHVASVWMQVPRLPPRDTVRLLSRHDPAGYLSAVLLAAAAYRQQVVSGAPDMRPAADEFFRARGIRSALAPNPRFATPEKTWAVFLESAKKGDAEGMLACFTADMRDKLRALFTGMSREQLREMADSFVGFSLKPEAGGYREAIVVRRSGERKSAGFAYFVNDGGEWKIQSM
jgi:hypothetical protein